jgi:hypothetical protein
MRMIISIVLVLSGCTVEPDVLGEDSQTIKCGAFDRCNPWQVSGSGFVTHNPNANHSCDLACTADGWPGGFCPLTDLGGLENSCTNICNGQIDKTVNPGLWGACFANCINSSSIECQAGTEPIAPEPTLDASKGLELF